jgi:hypothetical protein
MTRFMRVLFKHTLIISLMFLAESAASLAACAGLGADTIKLTISQDLALGTLTRPDTGTADATALCRPISRSTVTP